MDLCDITAVFSVPAACAIKAQRPWFVNAGSSSNRVDAQTPQMRGRALARWQSESIHSRELPEWFL